MTRRSWWAVYIAHRLLILAAVVATAYGIGMAVNEINDAALPAGDFWMRPTWAAWVTPGIGLAARIVYAAGVPALWVCVIAIGRILGRARARLDAPVPVPAPRFGRDATAFVDDADFAALARGTTQT